MYTSYCSLCCALEDLKKIESDSLLITDARKHLSLAVFYAEEYHKTWNSIYWAKAKSTTKRRIKERLNHLAFDAFSALLDASEYINSYVESVQGKHAPPPWWNEMIISLTLAHDGMLREHRREISSKQLNLLD